MSVSINQSTPSGDDQPARLDTDLSPPPRTQDASADTPLISKEHSRGDTPIHGKAPLRGCEWVRSAEGVEYLAPAGTKSRPTVESFYELLSKAAQRCEGVEMLLTQSVEYQTNVGAQPYDHYLLRSANIQPEDPVVVVRASVHGREIGAALTMLHQLEEMFRYAHERGVKLIVFPLDNPSGYATMNYRNIEDTEKQSWNRADWCGNNLGVVYVLEDGREVDAYDPRVNDPVTNQPFKVAGVKDIRQAQANYYIPHEARVVLEAIDKYVPMNQVRGFLDLHQDPFCTIPLTYQFGFGSEMERYTSIIGALPSSVLHMTNHDNEAHPYTLEGYEASRFAVGTGGSATNPDFSRIVDELELEADNSASTEVRQVSDKYGFIVAEDGTLPCLFHWSGVPHVAAIEISSVTPQEDVEKVYLTWIKGYIDLAAEKSP